MYVRGPRFFKNCRATEEEEEEEEDNCLLLPQEKLSFNLLGQPTSMSYSVIEFHMF
jgi:hypothetical protein